MKNISIEEIKNKLIDVGGVVSDNSITIMSVYLCTFFIYRDFGVRMFLGYGTLFLLLATAILSKIFNRQTISISRPKIAYCMLSIVVLLSLIRPSANRSSDNIVYLILMIISIGYFFVSNYNKKDLRRALLIILVTAIAFSIFVVFFQIFRNAYWKFVYPILSDISKEQAKRYAFRGYSVSIGGDYTYLDYILALGSFVAISMLGSVKHKFANWKVLSAVAIVLSFTILFVGRRGEVLALLVSYAVLYIFSSEKHLRNKRLITLFGGLIVAFILLILFLPLLSEIDGLRRYTNTIKSILYGTEILGGVTSGRALLYEEAWKMFLENPFFGVGWGSFSANLDVSITEQYRNGFVNVHNCLLQLLAETGLVGTILVLTPISYIYIKTVKATSRIYSLKEKNSVDGFILLASKVSLLIQTFIFTVALLDPSIYKFIFWVLYFVAVSLHIYSSSSISKYEIIYP